MTLSFRRLGRADFPLLSQWFSRPHVEPWWREEYDLESIERNYGPAVDGTDPTQLFVVEKDGEPIGFAQFYLLDDNPDWKGALAPAGNYDNAAGVDYLIGEGAAIGVGLGPEIIDSLTEMAWQSRSDVAQVVVSVQQGNRRSWRALEKAGFERAWAGEIDSDDPSDNGPSYVYVRRRPPAPRDEPAAIPHPAAVGPTPIDPAPTGPIPTGPISTGPISTGPISTGPISTGPARAQPAPSGSAEILGAQPAKTGHH